MEVWLIVLPALWLLFGLPWWEERIKRRHERERKARMLEWELLELNALRGREGLEAKLIADLHHLMFTSVLRAPGTDMEDITALIRGEVTEDAARLPVAGSDPLDGLGLWMWRLPHLPRRQRRRGRARRGVDEGNRRSGGG